MDIVTLALAKKYTKEEIAKLGTIQVLKGRVDTYTDLLKIANPEPGDVYIVGKPEEKNNEYIYAGDEWEELGPILELGHLATKDYVDEQDTKILEKIDPMTISLTANELKTSLENDAIEVGQSVLCTDKNDTYQQGHTYTVKEKVRGEVPIAQQLRDLGFTVSTSFENTLKSNGIKYFYIVEYGDAGKMYTAYSKVPLDVSGSKFPANEWKTFSVRKKNSSDPNLYYYQSNTYKNLTSMTQLTSSTNSGLYWATNFSPEVVATYSNDPNAAAYTKYVIDENEIVKYVEDIFPIAGQEHEACDLISGFNDGKIPAGAYFAVANEENFTKPSTTTNLPVHGVFMIYKRKESNQTGAIFIYSKYENLDSTTYLEMRVFSDYSSKLPTSGSRLFLHPLPASPNANSIGSAFSWSGGYKNHKLVTAEYIRLLLGEPASSNDGSNMLASKLKTNNKAVVAAINELYDTIATLSGSNSAVTYLDDTHGTSENPFILEDQTPGIYQFSRANQIRIKALESSTGDTPYQIADGRLYLLNIPTAETEDGTVLFTFTSGEFGSIHRAGFNSSSADWGNLTNLGSLDYSSNFILDNNGSINGEKIFNALPKTSLTPTEDTHLVNKAYVDTLIGDIQNVLATLTTLPACEHLHYSDWTVDETGANSKTCLDCGYVYTIDHTCELESDREFPSTKIQSYCYEDILRCTKDGCDYEQRNKVTHDYRVEKDEIAALYTCKTCGYQYEEIYVDW